MSTPPKRSAILAKAASTAAGSVRSQATASAPSRLRRGLQRRLGEVDERQFGAFGAKRFGDGEADAARRSGDDGDLARQRLLGGLGELDLFERPVFEVEQVALRQRREAAHAFGFGDDLDSRLDDVGGDARLFGGGAGGEYADAGNVEGARARVEHGLAADARVVALEIGAIVCLVGGDGGLDRLFESVEIVARAAPAEPRPCA